MKDVVRKQNESPLFSSWSPKIFSHFGDIDEDRIIERLFVEVIFKTGPYR